MKQVGPHRHQTQLNSDVVIWLNSAASRFVDWA